MNRMVRHSGARFVANALVFALIAPIFGHLGAAAAYAQANRLTRQLRVIVLGVDDVSEDKAFDNLSSLARDSVWVEMQNNRWFLPMPQPEVEAALERGEARNEFQRPLDAGEQQRLAESENSEGVCTGRIEVLGIEGDPRIATVRLQLYLLDVVTGMYINGATCVTSSDARPGFDGPDSTLVQEALTKAAHEAVEQMGRYEVTEGYVLAGEGTDTIRISVGTRDGVEDGDRLAVVGRVVDRGSDRTYAEVRGVISVTEARATYSVCKRVEQGHAYPVMTGDFVRKLFSEARIGAEARDTEVIAPDQIAKTKHSKTSKNLGKILLTAALIIVGAILISQNNSHTDPGIGVRASGVNIPGLPTPALRVRWDPGSAIPQDPNPRAGYIVGYEIHRGTTPQFPITPNSMIDFLEGGRNKVYDDDCGNVPSGRVATIEAADSDVGIYPVTIEFQDDLATPTWDVQATTISYTYNYTPPVPGQQYYYAVRVVSKKLGAQPFPPSGDDDEDLTGSLRVSVGGRCGPATPIEPPSLVSPPDYPDPGSRDIDLDTQLFEWDAVQGADIYAIEMSTDRTFPSSQTIRSADIQTRASAGTTLSRQFLPGGGQSPSDLFANWTGPIFWRVGARKSTDQYLPVDVSGKESRFVFGVERSFQALELPPVGP